MTKPGIFASMWRLILVFCACDAVADVQWLSDFFLPQSSSPVRRAAGYEPVAPMYQRPYYTPYGNFPPYHHPQPPPMAQFSLAISLEPNTIVLRCRVEEPLEHITWLHYRCPDQYIAGDGAVVAQGSTVFNETLYAVKIVGENGEFSSELLIRDPLSPSADGLYRCEAWPHEGSRGAVYRRYQKMLHYASHDEFLVGGKALLEKCFGGGGGGVPSQYRLYERQFSLKKRKTPCVPDEQTSQQSQINATYSQPQP